MRDRPLPAWQRRSALAAEEADCSGLAGKPAFVASERPFCRHVSALPEWTETWRPRLTGGAIVEGRYREKGVFWCTGAVIGPDRAEATPRSRLAAWCFRASRPSVSCSAGV